MEIRKAIINYGNWRNRVDVNGAAYGGEGKNKWVKGTLLDMKEVGLSKMRRLMGREN